MPGFKNDDLGQKLTKPKDVQEILNEQIEIGLHEHRRSNMGLFLSAFSAGLEVGFSIFLMSILYSMFHQTLSPNQMQLLIASAYPIGFIFVVIGRSELFTEHTTLAVIPVLAKSASVKSLAVLWTIVYFGNLLGGYLFAILVGNFAPSMEIIQAESFAFFATKLVKFDWEIIIGSSILAGWLMGLLSWLVTSSTETISRILIIILITSLIGLGGLHHSIVGSIEVFLGMITSEEVNFADYLYFQALTTVGNAVGGVFFVAIIKYSHTKRDK